MKCNSRILSAALLALTLSTSAMADHPSVIPDLGTPVHADVFDRQIVIDSRVNSVRVQRNETVRFVIPDRQGQTKAFVWRFDTRGFAPIELGTIAPAGVLGDRSVTAYVARGIYDRGR